MTSLNSVVEKGKSLSHNSERPSREHPSSVPSEYEPFTGIENMIALQDSGMRLRLLQGRCEGLFRANSPPATHQPL